MSQGGSIHPEAGLVLAFFGNVIYDISEIAPIGGMVYESC